MKIRSTLSLVLVKGGIAGNSHVGQSIELKLRESTSVRDCCESAHVRRLKVTVAEADYRESPTCTSW